MGEETILRVNIEPSKTDLMKQQWKDVKQMFDNTLPQARIVSIQRIQDKFNWEMYQVYVLYFSFCLSKYGLFLYIVIAY